MAAKHFLQLALHRTGRRPRVINVDGHPAYATAISELKESGELGRRCRCRLSPYSEQLAWSKTIDSLRSESPPAFGFVPWEGP